ncbi:hypothetical protein [Marivirga harenae]|uniref:hypothetical protein n=1 Tax=Marivirga harenae TaxID=2010992 RepID=UPI0026E061D5|nr:hypothetical protein [Marivirga harenae]WKV11691.1 hypothetical protein Q3Y49_15925 [Marivirga harenae]|tara:strand:- start:194709 stop:195326 length:618 start_codon:yes stop_codon:yes gene_type:complete
MKKEVIQNLEDFFNDFQYFKMEGYDAFHQSFLKGRKIIVGNITPYEDGLMLEIQLALTIDQVEDLIFRFYNQDFTNLKLTYWENLSQISEGLSKRSFIQNTVELRKALYEIESALVKRGFSWLDEFTDLKILSDYIQNLIFAENLRPKNLFKLCQRSYLLRLILHEQMTEATFYDYYEELQAHKIPEHQLEEFIAFRKYLASVIF